MDKSNRFHNFHFERKAWFFNPRLLAVGISVAVFSLAWLIVPLNFLFFLMLLPVVLIVWAASYGWRSVLSTLLDWLHRLERL